LNAQIRVFSGNTQLTAGRNITLNAGSIVAGANVGLDAGGRVVEAGAGSITATDIAVDSVGGTTLGQVNSTLTFDSVNIGGDVIFINSSSNLNITGIQQLSGGNVTLTTTGGTVNANGQITGANNLSL